MPKKDISRTEAKKKIDDFFKEIGSKSSKQIKKIKRTAMKHRISLKDNKKLFCKKCLTPYTFPKTRIKNKMKIIECENCGKINRWKIK
jgi:RNase P subunit RPR2